MKNVKLFLKSLFSNNAAIDGGRKKPWYAAIIIFLLSIIVSVVPSTVIELKKHGDKYFESTTYGAIEATAQFSEELAKDEHKSDFIVKENKQGDKYLVSKEFRWDRPNSKHSKGYDYSFVYATSAHADGKIKTLEKESVSYFVFTPDTLYIKILDPNDFKTVKVNLGCINAYKKIEKDQIKKALVKGKTATETANKTWENWKVLIKNFFNQTRLKAAGLQLAIISAVNTGIVLIMGFMIWVLTRGKNNPYRLFNVWESFKISFWACPSPAILTIALGFLISRFASTLFPLLLGVRVMWLTMKSLRPDGSGYAAN